MKPYVWLVLLWVCLPVASASQMAPVGGELAVAQAAGAFHRAPAVAAGELGTFVVVWQRHARGAEGWDVLARVYDRSGAPLGAEIVVNTTTAGCQQSPAVAADSAGSFVVVWQSEGQDGSGWGVFGRLFSREGVALGGEISIAETTAGDQRAPAVARDPAGAFLVTWQSEATPPDSSGWGVFARGFDAGGAAASPEFLVNAAVSGAQVAPAVAFVRGEPSRYAVVWQSQGQDGSGAGIYRRTFSLAGTAQSAEARVNDAAAGSQARPSVASDASGNFTVFWEGLKTTLSGNGLVGRRFNAASQPLGGEIEMDPLFSGVDRRPAVTGIPGGDFLVAWEREDGDGDGSSIRVQRFDHRQVPRGAQLQVNSTVPGDQAEAAGAASSAGDVFLAWGSTPAGGGEAALLAQRYAVEGLDFYTVAPCRVVDTRDPEGPLGGPALAAGVPRVFEISAAACGVPVSARAISLNLTATEAAANGNVVVYPGDTASPMTSSVNFTAGVTRANNAIAALSRDGLATLAARASTGVHLILDVNGYFE